MNFRKLGKTDIKVSTICLGTMTWGEQNSQKDAFEQMDYAVDQGINFFDTAEMYSVPIRAETRGHTNQIIGQWFSKNKKRDKIILADKVAGRGSFAWFRPNGEKTKLNKKQINFAIDRSLKELQTDYIDVYQVHWPDRPTNLFGNLEYEHKETEDTIPIEETLDALNNLVKIGKVRYIGVSNETPWGVQQYLKHSSEKKFARIVSIQNSYNLLNRSFEVGLSEIAIREKVSLLGYSPLASGYLTGKYRNGKLPEGARITLNKSYWPRYQTEAGAKAVDEYWNLAKKHNIDPAQMAIKFCEIQPFITSVIIGATKMEQLKTIIDSIKINLSKELIQQIDKVQKKYSNPCP